MQASDFYCQHLLQHPLVVAEVGHQAFKGVVLVFELLQPPQLAEAEPGILLLSAMICLLATPSWRQTSPIFVPASTERSAWMICSLEHFLRGMGVGF